MFQSKVAPGFPVSCQERCTTPERKPEILVEYMDCSRLEVTSHLRGSPRGERGFMFRIGVAPGFQVSCQELCRTPERESEILEPPCPETCIHSPHVAALSGATSLPVLHSPCASGFPVSFLVSYTAPDNGICFLAAKDRMRLNSKLHWVEDMLLSLCIF